MINDPDVLILLFRLQSEALILEWYVFQLGLVDFDNDVITLVVLLHLGRHFGNLDTYDRRNLIVGVLSVQVNRHFPFALFATLGSLFIFFTLGCLFVLLARLAGWGVVWSTVQDDFGDPCRPQLLVADIAKLIILNRVNVPEALVDQIEDFGVELERLLVVLHQPQDWTAHKVAQQLPHVGVVVALHTASHLVKFEWLG